jgi:putative transposase
VEDRLRELAGIFAIDVCAYAVLDNHLHVVLQLNDEVAAGWSDEEVVRRWGRLFPPRGKDRQPQPVTSAWVKDRLKDMAWVAETRQRLNSLGWFMKCLKEPLARRANHEDKCRGTFWEARYKSIAILDEEALLTTLTYVDLNPLAAGRWIGEDSRGFGSHFSEGSRRRLPRTRRAARSHEISPKIARELTRIWKTDRSG